MNDIEFSAVRAMSLNRRFLRPNDVTRSFERLGFAVLLLLLGSPSNAFAEVDCTPYLRMHGLLRSAQAQCAFTQFNPEIVDTAQQCYKKVGAGVGASSIRAGADEFDRMASLHGQSLSCSQIERHFLMAVR